MIVIDFKIFAIIQIDIFNFIHKTCAYKTEKAKKATIKTHNALSFSIFSQSKHKHKSWKFWWKFVVHRLHTEMLLWLFAIRLRNIFFTIDQNEGHNVIMVFFLLIYSLPVVQNDISWALFLLQSSIHSFIHSFLDASILVLVVAVR